MKANTENFRDIFFRNELFTVPFFQRKYVWTESEWKRCLDDVRQAAAENIPHFMGSLIFKTEPRGPVLDNTIIDGQQRATTLSILYYVLCKKYNRLERLSQYMDKKR